MSIERTGVLRGLPWLQPLAKVQDLIQALRGTVELGREESKERRKSWSVVSFTSWVKSKNKKDFNLEPGLRLERAADTQLCGYATVSRQVSFIASPCNSEPRPLMSHLPWL